MQITTITYVQNKKSNKNWIISKSKIRTSNFMQTLSVNILEMSAEVESYHDDSSKHRLFKLNIIVLFKCFQGMLIFITEFRKWVACSQCIIICIWTVNMHTMWSIEIHSICTPFSRHLLNLHYPNFPALFTFNDFRKSLNNIRIK